MFLLGVDDEQGVRQAFHVDDAGEVPFELRLLVTETQSLLLWQEFQNAPAIHLAEFLQTLQPGVDGLEVGQHAAEPPRVDVGHPDSPGLLGHHFLGLLLRADEQHRSVTAADVTQEPVGSLHAEQRLLEIDDVDAGTLPEDVAAHLRVPPSRLVAEVHARFEKLPPGDDGQLATSCSVSPPPASASNATLIGTPQRVGGRVF